MLISRPLKFEIHQMSEQMVFTQSRSMSNNLEIANSNNLTFTVNKKRSMVTIAPLPRHCAQNSPNDLCGVPKKMMQKSVIFGVPVHMRGWGRALHIAFLKDPFSLKTTCNHSKYWNLPTF